MRLYYKMLLLGLGANLGLAQLTTDQKVQDFQALAALYAKRYGPYEWKRDSLGFDLMNIEPWLAKVRAARDDLSFYEVMSEYVASLNDAHDIYMLPSSLVSRLNFTVDVFEGKLLVDSVNRSRLPASEFGFLIGYELVFIDGQDAQTLLDGLLRYNVAANPRSTRRLAASLLTTRPQQIMPHAADVPEISTVVFRRPDQRLESYRIPWTRTGLPLVNVGKYTTPAAAVRQIPKGAPLDPPAPEEPASYLALLSRLQNCRIPDKSVVGFGAVTPVFAPSLPTSFTQRLGKVASDAFYSGVFEDSGLKIGFIRIPSYSPVSTSAALAAFRDEIAFFQANTDGLVVDEMRNPGGSVSYANQILSLLIPYRWRSIPFELRATSEWVISISSALESARTTGAPQHILDLLQSIKEAIVTANRQMRGRTDPVPLDTGEIDRDPATDVDGKVIAYTKPLIVLVDELSASGGDFVPATIQDNGRGPLVGWRTMGAGGNVQTLQAGTFSLGSASVTESLMIRKNVILSAEYPPAPYVENIGVRPEIELDYMTRDNLLQNGKPFVASFINAIVAQIQQGQ